MLLPSTRIQLYFPFLFVVFCDTRSEGSLVFQDFSTVVGGDSINLHLPLLLQSSKSEIVWSYVTPVSFESLRGIK